MMNALADTWHIVVRGLRSRIRMPVFIFMSLFQPILWLLLFTQLFEKSFGSMPGMGDNYLQFFTPGVVVMTVLFGSAFAGFGLLMMMDMGILSKMLATPVTRVSIIMGQVIAAVVVSIIQAAIIFVIAAIMGVHVATGVPGILLALFIVALLGLAFAAFSNGLALLVKRQETVMATTNLFTMPLMFLSSTMMPGGALPGWLNTVRHFNPVDYAVVGVRGLVLEGYVWSDLWRSLVVLGALAVAAVVFATLMFRRQAE
jgi:ABC-2 type transport system permease protein